MKNQVTFANFIKSKACERNMPMKTLVMKVGIPEATFYKYMREPGMCKLFVLRRVSDVLRLSDEDRAELTKF